MQADRGVIKVLKNKSCALFDLDGTLVDTSIDLGRATAFVLEQYGIAPKWTDNDYRRFVGNGAKKLLERAFEYKLNDNELERALELFKAKYNEILTDNAYIYEGMKEALAYLKNNGFSLAVVTNKPHTSAVIMVEKLFGKGYFDCIVGALEDKPKKPDPYASKLAISMLNKSACDAVFFGDSDVDVLTARNTGIPCVACSWGFRSYESLLSASPEVIIENPNQIINL